MKITVVGFENGTTIETVDNSISVMRQNEVKNVHVSTWDNIVDSVVKYNEDGTPELNRVTQRSRKAKNGSDTPSIISTYRDENNNMIMSVNGKQYEHNVQKSFENTDNGFTVSISRHEHYDEGDIRNVARIANGYWSSPDASNIDMHMDTYYNGEYMVDLDSTYFFRGNKKHTRATAENLRNLSEYRMKSMTSKLNTINNDGASNAVLSFEVEDFGVSGKYPDSKDLSTITVNRNGEEFKWTEETKTIFESDENGDNLFTIHTTVSFEEVPVQEYNFFQTKDRTTKVLSYRNIDHDNLCIETPCSDDFSIIYKENNKGGYTEEVYLVRKYIETESDIDFDVYSKLEKLAYLTRKDAYGHTTWEFDSPSPNVSTAKCYAYLAFGPEFINNSAIGNVETSDERMRAFRLSLTTFISNFSLFVTKTSDPVVQNARYIIDSFGKFLWMTKRFIPALTDDSDYDEFVEFVESNARNFWKREIEILTSESVYGKSIRNAYDNIDVCNMYAVAASQGRKN